MKSYKDEIQLVRNARGVWCLDTIIGCKSGLSKDQRGCYGDCYAARSAVRRGFDFSQSVKRRFYNGPHRLEVFRKLERIDSDFVRIGCSGDPSEDWQHTIDVLFEICETQKQIVIITRHWNLLTDADCEQIGKMRVCVNTSVSALDDSAQMERSLQQYNRLKDYCDSVLRVVTCRFNTENETGKHLHAIQQKLLLNKNVIDTAFRPSKTNPLVKDGVVIATVEKFMRSRQLVSKNNPRVYMGKCSGCKEQCGVSFFGLKPRKQLAFSI